MTLTVSDIEDSPLVSSLRRQRIRMHVGYNGHQVTLVQTQELYNGFILSNGFSTVLSSKPIESFHLRLGMRPHWSLTTGLTNSTIKYNGVMGHVSKVLWYGDTSYQDQVERMCRVLPQLASGIAVKLADDNVLPLVDQYSNQDTLLQWSTLFREPHDISWNHAIHQLTNVLQWREMSHVHHYLPKGMETLIKMSRSDLIDHMISLGLEDNL